MERPEGPAELPEAHERVARARRGRRLHLVSRRSQIVPYVRQPEDLVPGRPLFFASAIPLGGIARPVLVESHMGRPTKIEGNPEHPASLGATDTLTQAAVLGLYDPDRAQTVTFRGEVRPWSAFQAAMASALAAQKASGGAGLRILTEPITSPSLAELVATILQDYPSARWHQYRRRRVGRLRASAFDRRPGRPRQAVYHLEKADVIVSLEADFLGGVGTGSVRYTRDFADRRRVTDAAKQMNRLYVVESSPSLTGAKAEHRLPMKSGEIEGFAAKLRRSRRRRRAGGGTGHTGARGRAGGEVGRRRRQGSAGAPRAVCGHPGRVPAGVGARARACDEPGARQRRRDGQLRARRSTRSRPIRTRRSRSWRRQWTPGQVQLLVILGNNPAFTAPADVKFAERLGKVSLVAYLGLYNDETANLAHWIVPEAHPLESWGDPRAYDGTVTLMQPLIAPLYDAHTAHEMLATLTSEPGRRTLDIDQGLLDPRLRRRRWVDAADRERRDLRQR